jgi:hypothetical protein
MNTNAKGTRRYWTQWTSFDCTGKRITSWSHLIDEGIYSVKRLQLEHGYADFALLKNGHVFLHAVAHDGGQWSAEITKVNARQVWRELAHT